MSLSPEGRRRLAQDLYAAGFKAPNFRCMVVRLPKLQTWPSETTQRTNYLEAALRDGKVPFVSQLNPPATRSSPARLKEAFSWWFARAETRRIIERMMQP